jgi:acetyl-CoA C-acetyltransferase
MSMSDDVVIVSAARTPVGSFNGAFATTPAHDLGAVAIKAALERAGIEPGRVSEVIMGQILTAAQGQNPARQASIAAGIPVESPAWGVNQLCGSGLRTVALGYQALLNGDSEIVVAGGQESMSMAPHAQYLRGGVKMGGLELVDTMIKDGLWDAFNGYHMGNTAENVARQYQTIPYPTVGPHDGKHSHQCGDGRLSYRINARDSVPALFIWGCRACRGEWHIP